MLLLGSCNGKKNSNDGPSGIEPLTSTTKIITVATPQPEKKPQLLCRRSQAGAFSLCILIHVIVYMHVCVPEGIWNYVPTVCNKERILAEASDSMEMDKIDMLRSISAQGYGNLHNTCIHTYIHT